MGRFGAGQALRRTEDQRFLTGHGRYTDDITFDGEVHGVVVRSPHAHAAILSIDTAEAAAVPGVLAVLTCADLDAAGVENLPAGFTVQNSDGSAMSVPPRPALARDRVRYVGQPVAFVVAETPDAARDAAELLEIDYDPLDAVGTMPAALAEDAPQLWPDEAPGNVLFDWSMGDSEATDAAFSRAARVVSIDLVNQRVAPTAMEARNAIGVPLEDGRLQLITGSQGSHNLRDVIATRVLKIPAANLDVLCPDVGGGFGMRIFLYPEHILVLDAARRLGRPVRWIGDRSESFQTDVHGRDHLTHAELALDEDGHFLALRVDTRASIGAYISHFGVFIPTMAGTGMLPGLYKTPAAFARVRGIMTNAAPTDAYRGAGRPEAAYVMERLADLAGRETGLGAAEIRRRNLIPPEALPFTTPLGKTYDSGEFVALMEEAMVRADWDSFEARRTESAAAGKLRGIGMSTYVEVCAGGGPETATLDMDAQGRTTILIGTQSTGQGHETAYAQITADALGIPLDSITVVQGDTRRVATGGGTGGSRSLPVGGAALDRANDTLVAKAIALAAELLETAPDDVSLDSGVFRMRSGNRTVTWPEVAALAHAPDRDDDAKGLRAAETFQPEVGTFPNGCHIVEVEVDPETGQLGILRYTIVDDVGVTLNPILLKGQALGGVVQSIGQALMEEVTYDPESGQLISGTLMDYAVPRAAHVPDFDFTTRNIPCRTNPLGLKGAGEAGTIGATPAVVNAVFDALWPAGVRQLDMPLTPRTVWKALQAAKCKEAAE